MNGPCAWPPPFDARRLRAERLRVTGNSIKKGSANALKQGASIAFPAFAAYITGICRRTLVPAAVPVIQRVIRKLGGRQALGARAASEAELARVVHRGLQLAVLGHAQSAGFSRQEIERFVIPARTLAHRKAKAEPLSVEESDRLVRLTRIQALAEDVFADAAKANAWLRAPLGLLDGKPPLEIARTEAGARVVEQLLAKIDWGAAA
jgi:putative toxin-antitoxin system antitoxin component (TIGR02293 family)